MLSDVTARYAKPKAQPYKLTDERGLYLLVNPKGGKSWRMNYRFGDKQNTLSFGTYPDVSLAQAREKREQARKLLADGIDPAQQRNAQKQAGEERSRNSFEVIGREWFSRHQSAWAKSHSTKIIRRLECDIFPWLGQRPIAEISAAELLTVLRRIEDRGAIETAHRAKQNCGQIFRYAIATGRAEHDIAANLKGALTPPEVTHLAAITEPKEIGTLLRAIAKHKRCSFITKCALRLAPLVFARPGELRTAKWEEIDLDKAQWAYNASKTKTPHIVPLSTQALAILRELHPLTGNGCYVFPNQRSAHKPMSENTVSKALRNMGYTSEEMTGHGFRAMARTVLDEVLNIRPEIIEQQLAHAVKDPNGRAYNRTKHLDQRRHMMQAWADYLDSLALGAQVLPFPNSYAG